VADEGREDLDLAERLVIAQSVIEDCNAIS
jgi:hypothetical protein